MAGFDGGVYRQHDQPDADGEQHQTELQARQHQRPDAGRVPESKEVGERQRLEG
uniref:hypothetical protein n=1 Tax=Natrinema pallidum TaxID=69527 RepID=UPI00187DA62D